MRKKLGVALLSFLCLTACGQNPNVAVDNSASSDSSSSVPAAAPAVSPSGGSPLNICSTLNLNGLSWPISLESIDRKAMALSMNITGSYEGESGWDNITGNSDGQGVSLGLLQQNFGQGTLQPLFLEMRAKYPNIWATYFSASDLSALNSMLDSWQKATGALVKAKRAQASVDALSDEELFPDTNELSSLDEADTNLSSARLSVKSAAISANQASVNWASATVLQSTNVITPRWKKAFQAMANSAAYRSIQVEKSLSLYTNANAYYDSFGFKELRSLVLMYDFVVQNGGFNSTQRANFVAYVKANPGASETQRANQLLTIRLASVRAAYQADVRARKSTIINGKGTVHGALRNLPVQYCYTASQGV